MAIASAPLAACSDDRGAGAPDGTGPGTGSGTSGVGAGGASHVQTGAGSGAGAGASEGTAGGPDSTSTGSGGAVGECPTGVAPLSGTGATLGFSPPAANFMSAVVDGKLLLLHGFDRSSLAPDAPPRLQVYDPVTDRWSPVGAAESPPPELATSIHVRALLGTRYLVAGYDAAGSTRLALFDPLAAEWELLDAASAPAHFAATGEPLAVPAPVPDVLLQRVEPLDYRPAIDAFIESTFVNNEREWNAAIAGSRLFTFGGRTARCDGDPGCEPAGYLDGNMNLPYMDQDVHGDGEVHDLATGSVTPISTEGAPSPRYEAFTAVLGSQVLVFGGLNSPHWGSGAGPVEDFALHDGALYDLETRRWSTFTPPVGVELSASPSLANQPGAARLTQVAWLGTRALVSYLVFDAMGVPRVANELYDPRTDRYTPIETPPGPFLRTRSGDLVTLAPDYTSVTRVDVEDGSTETTALEPPSLPEQDSVPEGMQLYGPMVQAWDGCRLFLFGYAAVRWSMPDFGMCPPGVGCDPAGPMAVEINQIPEGAVLTIGD